MTTPNLHDLTQDFCQVPYVRMGLLPVVATPTRVQKISDSLQLLLASGCLMPPPQVLHCQQSLGKGEMTGEEGSLSTPSHLQTQKWPTPAQPT